MESLISANRYEKLALAIAVAAVMSVAAALVGLTWRLSGDDGRRPPPRPVTASKTQPVDIAPILAFAPFGALSQPQINQAPTDLRLVAVFLADPRTASTAVIATTSAKAKGYAVGDTLPGGAVLDMIALDHVSLRLSGGLQTLALSPIASQSMTTTAAPPSPASAPAGLPPALMSASPIAAAQAASAPPPAAAPPNASSDAAGVIASVRRQAALDPKAMLQALGATPGPQGYQIGSDIPEVARAAGLMSGDVIERVNGATVGDLDRDRALFDRVVVSGQARLDVVRNGQRLALSFPLR